MIKVEVLEDFNLKRFDELENIERNNANTKGRLFKKDTFECNKELADYLLGNNPLKRAVVRVIEVKEEKKKEVENVIEKIGDALDKKIEVVEVKEQEELPKETKKKKKK